MKPNYDDVIVFPDSSMDVEHQHQTGSASLVAVASTSAGHGQQTVAVDLSYPELPTVEPIPKKKPKPTTGDDYKVGVSHNFIFCIESIHFISV